MNKSMTSLSFLDVNVWLALILEHHVHRASALEWWGQTDSVAAFTRLTQLGVLRLLTTAAAMDGQPVTMIEAWQVYDHLFEDERVSLYPEPNGLEILFRQLSRSPAASPKVWADAYLLAFATGHRGQLVTFDRSAKR